jgi:hypothetical protein
VIALMDFRPKLADVVKTMSSSLFTAERRTPTEQEN